jgi:hypothetical protein
MGQFSFHRRGRCLQGCSGFEEAHVAERDKTFIAQVGSNVNKIIRAIEDSDALPALKRSANLHGGQGTVQVCVAFLMAALNLAKFLGFASQWQKKTNNRRNQCNSALHSSPANVEFPNTSIAT